MSTKILFGFHAVTVRLKTAPESIVEIHVDAFALVTSNDAARRQQGTITTATHIVHDAPHLEVEHGKLDGRRGAMVAVGRPPDPAPWHALSFAPLDRVAAAYREAGAEVLNLPSSAAEPGSAA